MSQNGELHGVLAKNECGRWGLMWCSVKVGVCNSLSIGTWFCFWYLGSANRTHRARLWVRSCSDVLRNPTAKNRSNHWIFVETIPKCHMGEYALISEYQGRLFVLVVFAIPKGTNFKKTVYTLTCLSELDSFLTYCYFSALVEIRSTYGLK